MFDLVAGAPIALPDPGTTVTPIQLGADGTVVANIAGAPIRKNRTAPPTLARWRPGDQQWETIITRGSAARVNSTGEIAVTASGELSVFQDDYGLLSVDDLIHPDQAGSWNKNATIMLRGLSDPLPGDSTGGAVLGMADGGTIGPHFVLIPDPAKAP